MRHLPLTLLLTGCGIAPGDFALFRIAAFPATLEDACYFPAEGPAPDVADDSATGGVAETWALFRDADGAWYLEDDGVVLTGTSDKDQLTLSRESRDVSWTSPDGTGDRITFDETNRVTATLSGDALAGTWDYTYLLACEGDTCFETPPECTSSFAFTGVRVRDAEVDYAL